MNKPPLDGARASLQARTREPWVRAMIAALSRERDVAVGPGWGEGNVVLTYRGKIFAIVADDRLVVKLPKARVDTLIARGLGTRFDPRKNGRVMKEWLVSSARRDRTRLAREAYSFVAGSQPKRNVRS